VLQVSELPPLIPLQTLFGNPAKTSAQVLFMHLYCAGRSSVSGSRFVMHKPVHVPSAHAAGILVASPEALHHDGSW